MIVQKDSGPAGSRFVAPTLLMMATLLTAVAGNLELRPV
jgi:hypothetical protein